MEQLDFAFVLSMLNELSTDLVRIAANLQDEKMDLVECCRQVSELRRRLNDFRETSAHFNRIYNASFESMLIFHL